MTKKHISISQIGTYTTCAYKWHVTYQRGIRVKRGDISPAALGDVFHVGMAAAMVQWYNIQDDNHEIESILSQLDAAAYMAVDAWDAENRPENKQAIRLIGEDEIVFAEDEDFYSRWEAMVTNAKNLLSRTIRNLDIVNTYRILDYTPVGELFAVPLIEFWIEQDVNDDYVFAGIVDMVAHNLKTGMIEVVDWKVRGKFASLESEQLSMQIGLYQHVLRKKYGIDAVAGVVYQVKNIYPQIPTLNKNGTMSRQKITTDWPTYRDSLLLAGLDPQDYIEEMQPKLSDVEFFRPLIVVRLADVTQKLWDNMVEHAKNISGQTVFPRAFGYACRFCPFAELCNAELYDHDTDELFETKYIITERVNDDEEIEE